MPLDLEAIRKRCEAERRAVEAALAYHRDLARPSIYAGKRWTCLQQAISALAALADDESIPTIPALIAELATTRAILADALAEVRRLRGALQPFAATDEEMAQPAEGAGVFELRYGYFQRARAALEAKP